MSDDELDPELLLLLKQSLGFGVSSENPPDTGVMKSAEFIYDESIDVNIVSSATKQAASSIWQRMQQNGFSTCAWSDHELHPKAKDDETVNFIFTMDLLNFSFWSELDEDQRFGVDYKGQRRTGYWSLVAILQRALEEAIPITSPTYWLEASDDDLNYVFRSSTDEPIPLLDERIALLRQAGRIMQDQFDGRAAQLVKHANHSAARLVMLLVEQFASFRDECFWHGKTVKFYKRAQIFVADLWACFDQKGYGHFEDIDHLTIFPDYRVPQMLQSLGVLWYSPRLESRIKRKELIVSGEDVEIEIRGCSIRAVESLRMEILRSHPEAKGRINSVLIDFFLYDTCKEREARLMDEHREEEMLPHHRTRSIWY